MRAMMRATWAAVLAGVLLAGMGLIGSGVVWAQREEGRAHEHVDVRHGHNGRYLDRGSVVRSLPRNAYVARFGPDRYWFHDGIWYRPYAGGFIVVGAPIGVFVPVLPPLYVTVPFGGVSYYYANDTYYVADPQQGGYDVVAPPPGLDPNAVDAGAGGPPPGSAPPPMYPAPGGPAPGPYPPPGAASGPPQESIFVYPKNGQSPDQISKDRYECHRWAVEQTGFDPTVGGGGVAPGMNGPKRADYERARNACLEGRGYTVR